MPGRIGFIGNNARLQLPGIIPVAWQALDLKNGTNRIAEGSDALSVLATLQAFDWLGVAACCLAMRSRKSSTLSGLLNRNPCMM